MDSLVGHEKRDRLGRGGGMGTGHRENFPLQSQMYYCNQRQRKHFYDWIRTYNAKSGEYEQIAIGETE